MEIQNNFRKAGEKENEVLMLRVTKTQKQRLKALAEGSGFKSMSDYIRIQLLNPSIEAKLNQILQLIDKNKFQEKEKWNYQKFYAKIVMA